MNLFAWIWAINIISFLRMFALVACVVLILGLFLYIVQTWIELAAMDEELLGFDAPLPSGLKIGMGVAAFLFAVTVVVPTKNDMFVMLISKYKEKTGEVPEELVLLTKSNINFIFTGTE